MDDRAPPLPTADALAALKALKVVIASDALTQLEDRALAAAREAFPVGDEAWREVAAFDVRGAALQEILPRLDERAARCWLHQAIRACWGDAVYSTKEQAAVAHAAALFGIAPPVLRSVEALVALERDVEALRAALLGG